MLQLCGIPLSNYYNKVKLVLLEHDIPFEEVKVGLPIADPALLSESPIGKVPFLRTEEGPISESQAIVEYLAARYPQKQILPADPFAAAKARQFVEFVELYLEWAARDLYPEAFFGGKVSDGTKQHVQKRLVRGIDGLKRMTSLKPYALGETFGIADVAAYIHLPLVALATQAIYGTDLLLAEGIDWKTYAKRIGERRAARRVTEDRNAFIAATKPNP